MENKDCTSRAYILDHPEIKELLTSIFSTLVVESDRGAVLIGASNVDLHLRKLFETVAPKSMNRRELKRLLDYPGPLSSLSAKVDIAYTTRLISEDIRTAVHHLRRIRNDVAHSPDTFCLSDHEQRLRQLFELGPGVPTAINQLANELILHSAIENALQVKDPTSNEARPIFDNPQEVLEYISQNPEILVTLDERRLRFELAWGVGLICGLIVHDRECAKELLGENAILSLLERGESLPEQTGNP